MEQLKLTALTWCTVILVFCLIRALIPRESYTKYLRFALNTFFVLVLISGLKSLDLSEIFSIDLPSFTAENDDVSAKLSEKIASHLNESLRKEKYLSYVTSVSLKQTKDGYEIQSITLKSENDYREAMKKVMEISGVKEAQIYETSK